ncbi:MAG: BamA/TamA family outer membrane protein [Planctomycetota bacterium]
MSKTRTFAWLCAAALLSITASAAFASDGDTIVEVKVYSEETGAESIYAEKIADKVLERTRRVMNVAEIRKVLDEFYHAKIIATYKILEEFAGPGRTKVIIYVRENIEVRSVKFLGTKTLKPEDAMRVVYTRVGQPLSEALVHKDAAAIEKLYKERGHIFANVSTPREGYADGIVIFLAEEGPQVIIKKMLFNGNHQFSDKKLLTQMTTRPRKLLGLLGKGVYNEENLERDLERVANFYRSEGFLNVLVGVEKLEFSEDRSEMYITIYIEEGQRFSLGRITFAGNRYFTDEELKAGMSLKEGGTFRISDYNHDIDHIRSLYTSRAYVDVVVGRDNRDVTVIYHEAEPVVDLHFDIAENEEVYIGNIVIRGNKVTQDKVVRRELSFYPMEKFNYEQVEASRGRLMRLGGMQNPYFKDVRIIVDTKSSRAVDGKTVRDLVVELKESDSFGSIRLAAGISSNQGLVGDIALVRTNFDIADLPKSFKDMFVDRTAFLGAGQYFAISASPGTEFSRFKIDFSEPYLFDKPVSFDLSLFMWDWQRESHDEARKGISVGLGKRLARQWIFTIHMRAQSIEIGDVDSDAPPDVMDVEGKNSLQAVRLSLVKDVRQIDQSFKAYGGYRTFVWVEPVFGDFSLFKVSFGSTRYRTIHVTDEGLKHILKLHAEAGFIFGGDSPIYERYYLGGAGSMRGFDYRGVGPHQRDDPVGGDTLFLATVEYTFPVLGDVVRGVIFTDVGTLNTDAGSFGNMRAAVGFGLRIFSPQVPIPISIDFGFPIMKEDEDDTQIVSFTIALGF